MAADKDLPQTFEEALKDGGREITEEEFEAFIKQLGPHLLSRNLVDCTQPENDQRLCFHTTECYKGQRVFRFCENRLCQRTVIRDC
jgi:hypothetical protein